MIIYLTQRHTVYNYEYSGSADVFSINNFTQANIIKFCGTLKMKE